MSESFVDHSGFDAEGRESLRADAALLGLPLSDAVRLFKDEDYEIQYTRPVRGATDSGTPRVVRVKDGIITAAFFNDTLKEGNI